MRARAGSTRVPSSRTICPSTETRPCLISSSQLRREPRPACASTFWTRSSLPCAGPPPWDWRTDSRVCSGRGLDFCGGAEAIGFDCGRGPEPGRGGRDPETACGGRDFDRGFDRGCSLRFESRRAMVQFLSGPVGARPKTRRKTRRSVVSLKRSILSARRRCCQLHF